MTLGSDSDYRAALFGCGLGRGAEKEITVMYYNGHMSGWGIALMTVSGVVFWGLVVVGIVLLVRYVGRSEQAPRQPPSVNTPEQMLVERFARGEIDEPEYTGRLATLRGRVP